MIPRGLPVVDAVGAAAILAVTARAFRDIAKSQEFPAPLNPARRKFLYDHAQVIAYRDGSPLPDLPEGEHPGDLLDEHDVAAERGVQYVTVRKERHEGRLTGWVEVCGVAHMPRSTLTAQLAARPGRGVGGGRPRKTNRPDAIEPA